MTAGNSVISLFPLHTVLFPGGPLPLRIFETRYVDMVRRCMRAGESFGVVLIEDGEEAGAVASTAVVGCSARIADFNRLNDGLLGISCVGERRFRVDRVWRAADGLNMAEVSWLAVEAPTPLPAEFAAMADAVRRALDELAEVYLHVEKKFDDATWVGARLAELLPLAPNDKQALLELEDPVARLTALQTVMEKGSDPIS